MHNYELIWRWTTITRSKLKNERGKLFTVFLLKSWRHTNFWTFLQIEWTPPKPRRSSAPSPPKSHIPVLGWSLQPERQELQELQNKFESSTTTKFEMEQRSNSRRTSAPPMSTNIRQFESTDRPSNGGRGRKNFEAFVMTGDRMINLVRLLTQNLGLRLT